MKPTPDSKAEICAELFAMAAQHLDSDPWAGDRAGMWHKKLIAMKLIEPVEGSPDQWRMTALGGEVHVDVVKVFLGVWAPTEVAGILHQNNLMSEQEMYELWAREDSGERVEDMLPPYVHRAFRQYFKIPPTAN
jgi:hypothetical protein